LSADSPADAGTPPLLDAAEEVFAERGFEAASLDDIGRRAGFTKGAIYSNFGNRDDLFLATLERRNARLLEAYAQLLAQTGRAEAADVAQVWAREELADRRLLALSLEFRLRALRDDRVRDALANFEQATERTIEQFVAQRLVEAGAALAVPIDEFATMIYAANQGLWQHVATCAQAHPRLFETFLRVLMRGASVSPDDETLGK
jgi:AcrR family transcriptional regulator